MILLFANTFLVAQNAFMPPDYFPDQSASQTLRLYPNDRQLINTANDLVPAVKYYHLSGANPLYLMDDKIAFTQFVPAVSKSDPDTMLRIDMLPYKSQTQPTPKAYYPSQDHVNFYYPHCSEGVTDVHGYDRIVYENYFPDIDLHVTSNSTWHKFFLVLHPNANASKLELEFKGQDQITIVNNALRLSLNQRTFEIPQATAYQCKSNGNITSNSWSPAFVNAGNGVVQFNIGNYNTNDYLVLEFAFPVAPSGPNFTDNLEWSTYYGGSAEDIIKDIAIDNSGHQFTAGTTYSNTLPGNISTTYQGSSKDIIVTMFNKNTHSLNWVTYFGGDGNDDAFDVSTMSNGSCYIVGQASYTNGTTYPISQGNGVFYDNTPSGQGNALNDGLIIKLAPTGLRLLATFFGTSGNVQIQGSYVDNNNNLYISGGTGTVPAVSGSSIGTAFLAKFDSQFDLKWSTNIDANGIAYEVEVDNIGNIYTVGSTSNVGASFNTSNNTFNFGGGTHDGFIRKYSPTHQLLWSTYFGGDDYDIINDLNINSNGILHIIGTTKSANNFPVKDIPNTTQDLYDGTFGGSGFDDAFLASFNTNGSQIWGTYWGGSGIDYGYGITTDDLDHIYFLMFSASSGLSTKTFANGLYYNSNYKGNGDLYIGALKVNWEREWLTYFGGSNGEEGYGITINGNNLYTVGFAQSDYEIRNLTGAYNQPNIGSTGDFHGFVSKFNVQQIATNTDILSFEDYFVMYPNPVVDRLIIRSKHNETIINVNIFDVLGRIILTKNNINTYQHSLNISTIPSGSYFIQITTTKGRIFTSKLVVQN